MVLKLGASGADVLRLQQALLKAGYSITIDGSFGPQTENVVKVFQGAKGLVADGVAGPLTLIALGIDKFGLAVSGVAGMDVSKFQPNIDWAKVKNAGIVFAFIKATEGTGYTNPYFHRDWELTKQNGIIRSPYLFFRPGADLVQQYDHFMKTFGQLEPGDLPCMLDWEVNDRVSATKQKDLAKKMDEMVEKATGHKMIIYSDNGFFMGLGDLSMFSENMLYIANPGASVPHYPKSWSTWTFWQTSFHGHVDGVLTEVDLDVFNGTREDLIKILV